MEIYQVDLDWWPRMLRLCHEVREAEKATGPGIPINSLLKERTMFWSKPKPNQYRIRRRLTGWEPQCSYTAGAVDGVFWFPLNENGYWLEPDAFNYGKITKHIAMTKDAAKRAVLRARAINQQHIAA